GAFVNEGWVSPGRAGFNNTDPDYFFRVLAAYDTAVGGPRYVSRRRIRSGSVLHELDGQRPDALGASVLSDLAAERSARKRLPDFVWRSAPAVKRRSCSRCSKATGRRRSCPG